MTFLSTRDKRTTGGITFSVDEVTPAKEALPMCRLQTSLELRSGCSVIKMPEPDLPAVSSQRMGKMFVHPLIEAIHTAFSQHRPLVLSPDSIWLTIAQGFGHHVQQHEEALRERLVKHTGRKTLSLLARTLDAAAWQDFIGPDLNSDSRLLRSGAA